MSEKAAKKRKKAWSKSVGPYGHRIRLFEDVSGIVYAEMRDPARPGKYKSISLRKRDRDYAIAWAKEEVGKWMAIGETQIIAQTPSLSRLLTLYLQHRTPRKVASEQQADHRRSDMWVQWLGAKKDMTRLSLRDWEGFIDARRSGEIDANGQRVDEEKRQPVRDGTVWADLVFLLGLLNWSMKWR